jgi:hypothetical protein
MLISKIAVARYASTGLNSDEHLIQCRFHRRGEA